MKKKYIITIITIFVLLSIASYCLNMYLPSYTLAVLIGGNLLMAILSLVSYLVVARQLQQRPQAFVGGVYAGTFLKLFACMGALLIYVMMNKATLYKPSVFVLFGIYTVYTVAETSVLQKMAKGGK